MHNKTNVVDILEFLVNIIHTQFLIVKCFITDNAKNICEGRIISLFQEHGILHQRSCTNSPQQNGVVEREHKHL